jgi:phosphoribosylaminoimidazole-succinocarboxamide synthase
VAQRDLKLVDMKFEFGRTAAGALLLADEISPDTMRLWDAHTDESLDKDVFREDKGRSAARLPGGRAPPEPHPFPLRKRRGSG